MGKTVGTIVKIAAVVAIAYFAPQLAGKAIAVGFGKAAAAKVGASVIGSTIASAGTGAALGEAGGAVGLGTNWKSGLLAGGAGANIFGGFTPAAAAGGAGLPTGLGAGGTSLVGGAGTTGVGGISTGTTLAAGSGASVGSGVTGLSGALGGAGSTAAGGLGAGLSAGLPAGLGAGGTSMVAGMGSTAAAAGGGGGLGGLLSAVPAGLKKVAPSLLAAGLVGSGMSAQMKAQQAELDKARQANAAFTQERFGQAQRLLGEADYYNPEYMGRQAGQAALIRGSIQEGEATRGLTGARLAAEQRRYRLGTARNVGTAFQQGFGTGATERLKARQAGIQSIPEAYPLTTEAGLRLDEARRKNQADQSAGWTKLLGESLGIPPLGSELPVGG